MVASIGLAATLVAPAAAEAAPLPPGRALVYGDSLTFESRFEIATQAAKRKGWVFRTHAYGATTVCDWLEWLPADIAEFQPTVITLMTSGNGGLNSCMGSTVIGSPEYFLEVRAYLDGFFATATASGARVVFFQAPPYADPVRDAAAKQLTKIATELAFNYHGVSIAGGIRSALGGTKYVAYKKCLPYETAAMGCANALIPIRTIPPAPDAGLHLCPSGLVGTTLAVCPTYSSGEFRLARATVSQAVRPPAPKLP